MKTRILSIFSVAALLFAGCYEDAGETGIDESTRISLSPSEISFTPDGTTADGEVSYVGVVQIMPFAKSNFTWTVQGDVEWATVTETTVDETFEETWTDGVTTTAHKAVEIMVTPNTEYRRSGTLTVTAQDGTVQTFPIEQTGLKADAEVTCEAAESGLEFASAGESLTVLYTTNMGDVYDYSATYDGESSGEWLSWSDEGAGQVVLTASEWTSKDQDRTAVFTIHVGTPDTSEASVEIAVRQLRVDDYYYLYGASVPRYATIDLSAQMNKKEQDIYAFDTYFAAEGNNPVLLNKNSRTLAYPYYALAMNGTIATIASEADALPAGPQIDIDGMRTLTVDFKQMTWSWERITTVNCLPDDMVADYPTKDYVTPRGTYKTWMTRNLNWDGGDGIGSYTLGCPLVFMPTNKDTGGYNSKTDPIYSYRNTALRNPACDDTENGGPIVPDAAITAVGGRHYTFYEYLTGAPRGGLMEEYYSEWPAPYTVGKEVRDAADYTVLFEGLTSAAVMAYAGREEEFWRDHPVSRIQIQGICPYGWHVANFQDWYDLLYAAYDFGSKNNGGYTPTKPSFSNTVYGNSSATYKINVVPYLRISKSLWTINGKCLWDEAGSLYPINEGTTTKSPDSVEIASNSEEFGFNLAPTGWRVMSLGWQDLGLKTHVWIPMPTTATYSGNGHTCYMGWRLVAMTNNGNWIFRDNYQNGNVAHGVRCVKNYDVE